MLVFCFNPTCTRVMRILALNRGKGFGSELTEPLNVFLSMSRKPWVCFLPHNTGQIYLQTSFNLCQHGKLIVYIIEE